MRTIAVGLMLGFIVSGCGGGGGSGALETSPDLRGSTGDLPRAAQKADLLLEEEAPDLLVLEEPDLAESAPDLTVEPPDLRTHHDLRKPRDLVQPDDLAEAEDLADLSEPAPDDLAVEPDLVTVPDLAAPPDLLVAPDLVHLPDLTTWPDLTRPPDLAPSCPGKNLAFDQYNCGACGNVCPAPPHARAACYNGACSGLCDYNFSDCNNDISDGCETSLTTATNCGGCGATCAGLHITAPACVGGFCSGACDPGWIDCNNFKGLGCTTMGTVCQ